MPWTVLIADDEPKIRRGLSQLLKAYGDEFEVVAEAEDGERALVLTLETTPDLVLVDVRMPYLDGLELIRRLALEGNTDRRIVVISGHDEFEYARQALALGVFDFLLKPVEEEVLVESLRKAVEDLEKARTRDLLVSRARALAAKNRPALLEGFIHDALEGALSAEEWAETAAFLGLSFRLDPQLVLVSPGSATQPGWTSLALRRLAEEAFAAFSNAILTWDSSGNLAILAEEPDEAVWVAALDQIEAKARDALGQVVSMVRAPVPGFPGSLAAVWEGLVAHYRENSPHGALAAAAMNVLERRYREVELTLDDIAGELQISSGHLSRVLKQATGTSFVDALSRVRVRQASVLLADPAVKVYEVAERVGYSSQHYFSRAFRRVLGVAPSDYRRGSR